MGGARPSQTQYDLESGGPESDPKMPATARKTVIAGSSIWLFVRTAAASKAWFEGLELNAAGGTCDAGADIKVHPHSSVRLCRLKIAADFFSQHFAGSAFFLDSTGFG